MSSKWFHNIHKGGIPRTLAKGIRARIFPGTHLMLSVVTLQPWSESPVHSHMNEQWGVCLEGKWIRIQGGREYRVKAGISGRPRPTFLTADGPWRTLSHPRHFRSPA